MAGSMQARREAAPPLSGVDAAVNDAHPIVNCMTVDVEEHFQVQAFAPHIARADWPKHESRVERNTDRVLGVFDEVGIKGTFFTLGWVAERCPALIRRIVAAGHELASHGHSHIRVFEQSPEEFREDVRRTKRILEDAGGVPVKGYRAASFSMDGRTPFAHDVLAEEGYLYSSSIFPVSHDHYGVPDAPRAAHRAGAGHGIVEAPLTTLRLFGRNVPCSGGGYFRLLPYGFSKWALRRVNEAEGMPAIFYFHPWEIDPDQPRQAEASLKSRFRHYVNLAAMEGKIRSALKDFRWGRMDDVFLPQGDAEAGPHRP